MTKENLAFLAGGFAFGILVGVGLFNAFQSGPDLGAAGQAPASVPRPAGPAAPTPMGGAGGSASAPMVAEINQLKLRLQQDPTDLKAATRLAHLHHDAQMWDQAVIFYKKAIELSPQDPDLHTDLGICYRGLGRFDEALARFAEARALNPAHWQSLFNSAVVLAFDQGDYDAALAALEPLSRMDPMPPRAAELLHAVQQARDQAAAQGSP
jgi:cytochrome c-type biogenesis protein CcmH/NrfG